jgi:hypothetical protein
VVELDTKLNANGDLTDIANQWKNGYEWTDLSENRDNVRGLADSLVGDINGVANNLMLDPNSAWNKGYNIGENIANGFNFNVDDLKLTGLNPSITGTDDGELGDLLDNVKDINGKMDLTEDDLKYLRDLAEQEVINRFTTAEIKVEMNNTNTITNTNDLDGLLTHLSEALTEELKIVRDGV